MDKTVLFFLNLSWTNQPFVSILNMKMANSNVTKRVLANSLKELVQEIPLEKITIADICASSGMNRKSFYYHFRDKYDLLKYIFQSEFMQHHPFDTPSRGESFYQLCQYLYENRDVYRHIFRPHQHNYFLLYFQETIKQAVTHDLMELQENTNNDFYVYFMTDGLTGAIQRWITHHNPMAPEEMLSKTRFLLEQIGLRISKEK